MLEGVSPLFLRVSKLMLICLFLFSVFFTYTGTIFAQNVTPTPGGGAIITPGGGTPIIVPPSGPSFENGGRGGSPAPATPSNPGGGGGGDDAGQAAEPASATEEVPLVQVGYYADASWYQVLFDLVVAGFGWLVAQLGLFLDYAINNFIVGFGEKYRDSGLGFTIDNLWGTVRDIFNLTFIFGLVYIGFQIILGTNESQAKRTIPLLILAALLVNFSLYITKLVVDFTNLAATQIFYLFQTGETGAGGVPEAASISIGIAKLLGISEIFRYTPDYGGGTLVYLFGMMIVLLVLAYVFLAGAILITIRFVALNIYMVFSPVMFLGWVFPGLSSYTRKFWSGFLGQAFFAPAFLFMLYLSFMVVDNYNDGVSKYFADVLGTATDLGLSNGETMQNIQASGLGSAGSAIPFFAMTIVFLIASMVVARKMGAVGADTVISVGDKLRGSAQGMLYRNTAGLALAGGVRGIDALDRAAERGGARGIGAKVIRGAIGGEATRKMLDKGANYGAGGYGREDVEKMNKERKIRATGKMSEQKISDAIAAGTVSGASNESKIAMERTLQNAQQAQIIDALRDSAKDPERFKRVVGALSTSQVNKLLESKEDEFTSKEKEKLRSTRVQSLEDRFTTVGGTLEKGISKASADDLAAYGFSQLQPYAEYIPAGKMDDLKNKLTPTEYSELESSRTTQLKNRFNIRPFEVFAGKKDNEIARLPKDILVDPRAVQFLNQRVLEIILRENYLESGDRKTVRTNITTMQGPNAPMSEYLTVNPLGKGF